MTLSITARRCYAEVNYAGRFRDGWTVAQPWSSASLRYRAGLAAAQRASPGPSPLATAPLQALREQGRRMGLSFMAQFAANVASRTRAPQPGSSSTIFFTRNFRPSGLIVFELLFGWGEAQSPVISNQPEDSRPALWAQKAYCYGLAGGLVEALPCHLAQRLDDAGSPRLAAACLFGAVAGRLVLQVPRLLVGMLIVADLSLAAALGIAAVSASRLLLRCLRLGTATVASQLGARACLVRHLTTMNENFDALCREWLWEEQPNIHRSIQRLVDDEIRDHQSDLEVEGCPALRQASICRVARVISRKIGESTAYEPSAAAYRGGLSHLRSSLERLFAHEDWDPADYLPALPQA